ncbi:MAG: ice-binding family protein [Ktedonobacteraceae bacterium]
MKRSSRLKRDIALIFAVLLFCALVLSPEAHFLLPAHAQATQPPLGTAASFAVLGGSAVTNTGSTVVTGDLGVSPGTAITGFPPGVVVGTIHDADAVALQAQNDVTTAYGDAAGEPCNDNLTGQDLGGKTLTSGVYCFSSSAQLTGQLVLNSQADPASVFIFQIGSTLTTASNASVSLINGAQACNIFWQVGSSATVGTATSFQGNILALTSITLTTGAISNGGLYARNGAVTLDTNTINRSPCADLTPTATATSPATSTATATPTATSTATATPTATSTATATPTATSTATATPTATSTSTATATPTATSTSTATATPTATSTSTATATPTATSSVTPTATPIGPPGLPPTGSDPDASDPGVSSLPGLVISKTGQGGSNFAVGQQVSYLLVVREIRRQFQPWWVSSYTSSHNP